MAGISFPERLRNISVTWHDTGEKWRRLTALWPGKRRRQSRQARAGDAENLTLPPVRVQVPKANSKKRLILGLCQAQGLERAGEREIRALQAELRRRLGADDRTSPSYIANVLRQAGVRVDYDDRYVDPLMEEPYATRLAGALQFHDLESAEASLQKLDAIYREYRDASDRVGTALVRSLVLKGRQRAESLAVNSRVGPEKRREKQEVANWFRVWLETSDLFFDWLELRKQSEEFQRLFSDHHGRRRTPRPA
jgi:hypothetical protein